MRLSRSFAGICLFLAVLLPSCSRGATPEEELEGVRSDLRDAAALTFAASVRADYGDRVFDFDLSCQWSGDAGVVTVGSPEVIAGATVRYGDGGAALGYDGVEVYTGEILPGGLSPADSIPVMVEAWRDGLVTEVNRETLGEERCLAGVFRIDDRVDLRTWFDGAGLPLRSELTLDGVTVITAEFHDFSL